MNSAYYVGGFSPLIARGLRPSPGLSGPVWNSDWEYPGPSELYTKTSPKIQPLTRFPAWLLRNELICWERIGQKAVDMPRVHRLSLTKSLNGSYKARVERRTKYSWKRRQIRPIWVKHRVVIEWINGLSNLWPRLSLILVLVRKRWFSEDVWTWRNAYTIGWLSCQTGLPDSSSPHCLLSVADSVLRLYLIDGVERC